MHKLGCHEYGDIQTRREVDHIVFDSFLNTKCMYVQAT